MNMFTALLVAGLLGTGATRAAEIVVIVNPAAEVPTMEQLADVYLGRSRAYSPTDHAEVSAIRTEFYRKATGRDPAQVKMAWSRLVFTGKGLPPRELPSAAAVKKAVAADPKAIGYIDLADLDGTVKAALRLD